MFVDDVTGFWAGIELKNDVWTWEDGHTTPNHTARFPWGPNNPNGINNSEPCARMTMILSIGFNFQLADCPCNNEFGYICERK